MRRNVASYDLVITIWFPGPLLGPKGRMVLPPSGPSDITQGNLLGVMESMDFPCQ
jgi:hypothetical protein